MAATGVSTAATPTPSSNDSNIPNVNVVAQLDSFHNQQRDGQIFFSLCFQRYETLEFYSVLLQKLIAFAKSFDEGTPASRENVWNQLYSLMGSQAPDAFKEGPLFSPLISSWLQESTINLFGLELLYVSFMTSTSANADANLNAEGPDATTPFTPWGSTIPCALYQLKLLQHWESKLEKLSVMHKKAIWKTCLLAPTFSNFDESSFRKTLARWASNPLINIPYIITLFGSLGFLKTNGVLKCDFCYPKTTIPVFPPNVQQQQQQKQNSNESSENTTNNKTTTASTTSSSSTVYNNSNSNSPVITARHSSATTSPNSHHSTVTHNHSGHISSLLDAASALNEFSNASGPMNNMTHTTVTNMTTTMTSSPTEISLQQQQQQHQQEKPIVHPYRRNSSVDFSALVASALTSLKDGVPDATVDPEDMDVPPSIKISTLPPVFRSALSTPGPFPRRNSRVDFNLNPITQLPVVVDQQPLDNGAHIVPKRRRSQCGEELRAEDPKRTKSTSVMSINSLLC